MINGFKGRYNFLSNFYRAELIIFGKEYASVEHYFQSCKTLDQKLAAEIRSAKNPKLAKQLGKKVILRPDWDQIKFKVMYVGLKSKFSNEDLKLDLLNTDFEYLEESNNWHDVGWGVCHGGCYKGAHPPTGQNYLGKLLMELRNEFRVK